MIKDKFTNPFMFEVDARLEKLLNLKHPLVLLSKELDWDSLTSQFKEFYVVDKGRPSIDIRLMVCLHYLKYLNDLSDEQTVWGWLENPYWQYFSGEEYFQTELPIDPSSMTNFRKRLKENGAEKMLAATIEAGLKTKTISTKSLDRVAVDTTVQPKHITYPTDAKLYCRMIEHLRKQAKRDSIRLRQGYRFVAKKLLLNAQRYQHTRKAKEARKSIKKLRTILGKIMRDIERKSGGEFSDGMLEEMTTAHIVYGQQRGDSNKLYSIHAPEVHCISKGKAGKKYEFGNKVSIAATLKEGFIVGCHSFMGNPYDGHTLKESLEQVGRLAHPPKEVSVDKGYRGHKLAGEQTVFIRGHRHSSRWKKLFFRRHSLIEAVIGHMKCEHRLDRCRLWGAMGDSINAMLSAAAFNLKKIMKKLMEQVLFLLFVFWTYFEPNPRARVKFTPSCA